MTDPYYLIVQFKFRDVLDTVVEEDTEAWKANTPPTPCSAPTVAPRRAIRPGEAT